MIGNLMMDALSAKKYYHFVRLMGRAASHITLECALQTHPQAAIICEEVHQSNRRLADIVHEVGKKGPCPAWPLRRARMSQLPSPASMFSRIAGS